MTELKYKVLFITTIISLFLSIAALGTSIFTFTQYNSSTDKKVVVSKQYDRGQSFEKAQKKEKPMLVFFYTDWCGYCQRFATTYNKVAKNKDIKKHVAIAYVNCEDTNNRELIKEYKIKGFPTVFVVKSNGDKVQLDNRTFFSSDSAEVITKNVLDIIK